MSRRSRRTLPCVVVVLALVCGPAVAGETESELSTDTALHSTAGGGELHGLLRAGTPVVPVETRGDWVKVVVEGWVLASAVEGKKPPAAPPKVEIRPQSVPTPTIYAVEGLVRVKPGRLKRTLGAGTRVWVLPGSLRTADVAGATDAEDSKRLEELEADAARLKREADKALQDISNFTEATETRDELMKERERVLEERKDVLAVRHGRVESAARQVALDSAVADTRGWFNFPGLSPGTYTIYARLIDDDLDLQWVETVEVASKTVEIELDESTAQGLLR
jgi:hypothetical protein